MWVQFGCKFKRKETMKLCGLFIATVVFEKVIDEIKTYREDSNLAHFVAV